MRSAIALAIFAGAALMATSCGFLDSIVPNGNVKTEQRPVPAFSSIVFEGAGTLRVHQGAQDVEITADSNVLPYLETTVSGTRLSIGLKPFTTIWGNPTLVYEVTLPSLDGVALTGSGNASIDAFSGNAFDARISGSGGMTATLYYNSLSFTDSGSGDAGFSGTAADAHVSIIGSGGLSARNLATTNAVVSISGSGGVDIRAASTLNASIFGSGQVSYWGSPSVSQTLYGSGRVIRAGN